MTKKYGFNALTGKFDIVLDTDAADDYYVKKVGDTMTGRLTINPTSDATSLNTTTDIVIRSSRKLIFDGA